MPPPPQLRTVPSIVSILWMTIRGLRRCVIRFYPHRPKPNRRWKLTTPVLTMIRSWQVATTTTATHPTTLLGTITTKNNCAMRRVNSVTNGERYGGRDGWLPTVPSYWPCIPVTMMTIPMRWWSLNEMWRRRRRRHEMMKKWTIITTTKSPHQNQHGENEVGLPISCFCTRIDWWQY